jgi:branched-chain amino acid aminotransferase
MTADIYYIDGNFVSAAESKIPVNDLGLIRGYGVFEVIPSYKSKIFHLEDHIERLFRSAAAIELDMPWTVDEILEITNETYERNDHARAWIRVVITGGISPNNIMPTGESRLIVTVAAVRLPPAEYYSDGVKIVALNEPRYLPGVKSTNYIPAIRALKKAELRGAASALYMDDEGFVPEGPTTNLFAFYGNQLVTSKDNILPGITRLAVLKLAEGVFPVEYRQLKVDELYQADEVFITSTTKEVMPVVQVDDAIIGDGKVGERTKNIMRLFADYAGID